MAKAIETVYKGNVLLQPEIAKKVMGAIKGISAKDEKEDLRNELTKREYEIALLVSEGKTNKEISQILFITEGTVKNHISNILDKLDLKDRTQLALRMKKL